MFGANCRLYRTFLHLQESGSDPLFAFIDNSFSLYGLPLLREPYLYCGRIARDLAKANLKFRDAEYKWRAQVKCIRVLSSFRSTVRACT